MVKFIDRDYFNYEFKEGENSFIYNKLILIDPKDILFIREESHGHDKWLTIVRVITFKSNMSIIKVTESIEEIVELCDIEIVN